MICSSPPCTDKSLNFTYPRKSCFHNGLVDLVFSYECVNAPTILELRSTPMAGGNCQRPWRSVYEAIELLLAL